MSSGDHGKTKLPILFPPSTSTNTARSPSHNSADYMGWTEHGDCTLRASQWGLPDGLHFSRSSFGLSVCIPCFPQWRFSACSESGPHVCSTPALELPSLQSRWLFSLTNCFSCRHPWAGWNFTLCFSSSFQHGAFIAGNLQPPDGCCSGASFTEPVHCSIHSRFFSPRHFSPSSGLCPQRTCRHNRAHSKSAPATLSGTDCASPQGSFPRLQQARSGSFGKAPLPGSNSSLPQVVPHSGHSLKICVCFPGLCLESIASSPLYCSPWQGL